MSTDKPSGVGLVGLRVAVVYDDAVWYTGRVAKYDHGSKQYQVRTQPRGSAHHIVRRSPDPGPCAGQIEWEGGDGTEWVAELMPHEYVLVHPFDSADAEPDDDGGDLSREKPRPTKRRRDAQTLTRAELVARQAHPSHALPPGVALSGLDPRQLGDRLSAAAVRAAHACWWLTPASRQASRG